MILRMENQEEVIPIGKLSLVTTSMSKLAYNLNFVIIRLSSLDCEFSLPSKYSWVGHGYTKLVFWRIGERKSSELGQLAFLGSKLKKGSLLM